MSTMFTFVWIVSGLALLGLLSFFAYPLGAWLVSRVRRPPAAHPPAEWPRLSLLIVVRNSETLIADKVRNALTLDYPAERLEVVVCSDGSTDGTNRVVEAIDDPRLKLIVMPEHRGKIPSLNHAMDSCTGEIVVLSDADAILDPDALRKLVAHFADPQVGGVCGQRLIAADQARLGKDAQASYIGFDSRIKSWESRCGSITSNDGKLYAIRRELFHPIAPATTDDLFVALDIVRQHRRFTFEPAARARIRVPSRSPAHETERRRRIVCQSYRAMYLMRRVLNPFEFGGFSFALTVNKIVRRLVPFCLLLLLLGSLVLSLAHPWMLVVFGAQVAFYLVGLLHAPLVAAGVGGALGRIAGLVHYFVLGQYGTLLGVVDFLSGRRVAKWDPVKTEGKAFFRS